MLGGNFATGDMTNGDPSSSSAAGADSGSDSSSYDFTKAVTILGDPSNPTNKGYLKLSDNIQSDQVNLRNSILKAPSTPNIPPPPSSRGGITMLPVPPATNPNPSGIAKSGVLSGGQGSSVPGFSSVNLSETAHIGAVSSVFGVMEN